MLKTIANAKLVRTVLYGCAFLFWGVVSNALAQGVEEDHTGLTNAETCIKIYNINRPFENCEQLYSSCLSAIAEGEKHINHIMGVVLFSGRCNEMDLEKSKSHFVSGAEAGDAKSDAYLAYMYLFGIAGEADMQKAYQHGIRAAEAGVPRGQFVVGMMYLNGLGVQKDVEKARNLFELSAKNGFVQSIKALHMLAANGSDAVSIPAGQ